MKSYGEKKRKKGLQRKKKNLLSEHLLPMLIIRKLIENIRMA